MKIATINDASQAKSMNHTILHIGAGEGLDIERQLASKPKRLILIEPNPDIAARLREKTRVLSNVEVHELAVTASVRAVHVASLHEYNWNTASSLQEAAQLAQLFPGLQLVHIHEVEALSPVALIERLELNNKEEHSLIIEAPGVENGIIEALCDSRQIGMFSTLTLSCPCSSLHTASAEPTDLVSRLIDFGFEMVKQDENDPDWPVFVLEKNRWRYEVKQADKRLKMLELQVKNLQEENGKLDRALKERIHELDEKTKIINKHKVLLEQTVQARNTQTQLATEFQAEIENLKADNASQSRRAAELKAKLDQATRDRDKQIRLVTESRKLVSEQEAQLADLEQRKALMEEEMHRAEGQIDLITDVLLREPGL